MHLAFAELEEVCGRIFKEKHRKGKNSWTCFLADQIPLLQNIVFDSDIAVEKTIKKYFVSKNAKQRFQSVW